jgi:hypothetical protein
VSRTSSGTSVLSVSLYEAPTLINYALSASSSGLTFHLLSKFATKNARLDTRVRTEPLTQDFRPRKLMAGIFCFLHPKASVIN